MPRAPTVETQDVLTSFYSFRVEGESFQVSMPERGNSMFAELPEGSQGGTPLHGQPTVTFGVLPSAIPALERYVGLEGRIFDSSGHELILFRVEHVSPQLNLVVGTPSLPLSAGLIEPSHL